MSRIKRISAMILIIALAISIFSSVNITSYAQETTTMNDTEISELVENELMCVMDEVLNHTNDMYTVNEEGKLIIVPSSAHNIIYAAVKDVVIENLNITLDEESQNNINTAFNTTITNLYNSLLDYYNEEIDKGVLSVTPNGTLYETSDNEACVQGGNINKTVRTVGVYFHFYDESNSAKQSTKYYNGYLKAKSYYDKHKNDPNWIMSDDEFEDIMTGMGDEFGENWAAWMLASALDASVTFTKYKMKRDNSVHNSIDDHRNGYGTIVRINAARSISVGSQQSYMTDSNAKNYINNVNYDGPFKLFPDKDNQ